MWISVNPVTSRCCSASATSSSVGRRPGVLLLLRRRERAELALHAAHVRLVQIQVLDEVDAVVAAANAACEIGQLAEREQVVRLHQRKPVLEVEAFVGLHLFADQLEGRVDGNSHG